MTARQGPGRRIAGTLPAAYRVGSASAAVLLPAMGLVLLTAAGVVRAPGVPPEVRSRPTWGVVVPLALNTVENALSRSAVERWGMGSLGALVTVLAAVTARAPVSGNTAAHAADARREARG